MKELISALKATGFTKTKDALEAELKKVRVSFILIFAAANHGFFCQDPSAAREITKLLQNHVISHVPADDWSNVASVGGYPSTETDFTNPPTLYTNSAPAGLSSTSFPPRADGLPLTYACKSCENVICERKSACDRSVRSATKSKLKGNGQGFFLKPKKRYLFKEVVGIRTGESIQEHFITGRYKVRMVFCGGCGIEVGFKYRIAPNEEHKWKVGKYALYGSELKYGGQ